jgi:hypothetical protein
MNSSFPVGQSLRSRRSAMIILGGVLLDQNMTILLTCFEIPMCSNYPSSLSVGMYDDVENAQLSLTEVLSGVSTSQYEYFWKVILQ